jgi:hypothetical protein
VNVNNINRYNYVHKNVNYNNVQANNTRVNRNGGPGGNRPGNFGNNGGPGGGSPGENRSGVNNKIIDRNINRNNPQIDQYRGRDNTNNNVRNDRPPNSVQPNRPNPGASNDLRLQNRNQGQAQGRPAQPNNAQSNRPNPGASNDLRLQNRNQGQAQGRPPAQPSVNNGPHTFNKNESHFDPRVTSQRGQDSRQQAARPQPPARPAAQPSRPAPAQHGGGEKKKP